MGKPPTYIETFKSPNRDHEAEAAKHAANPKVTKAVYVTIIVALFAFFVLVGIGLHIPTGG